MNRPPRSGWRAARQIALNGLGFIVALWLGVTLTMGWCTQFGGCGSTLPLIAGALVGVWLFIAVRIWLGSTPVRELHERERVFALRQKADRLARELRDERARTEWQRQELALCNAQIEHLMGRKVEPAPQGRSEPEAFTFR